jgi:uncharacterized protein YprB with RNaseH-like and TPR domain
MLTATFCCFQGVSRFAEQRLWETNCLSWTEALVTCPKVFSDKKLERVRRQIIDAQVALDAGFADYFLNRLRAPETIRVLPHFRDGTAYLDIETTGLGPRDTITTIALYRSHGLRCFIKGRNLIELLRELSSLSLLITYNGTAFDLPRIRKELGINLQIPHLDLLPCLNAIGFRGGLKRCEKLFGLNRQRGGGVSDGQDAVVLWHRYEADGDEEALRDLVRYNLQDAVSLEYLAVEIYNRVMAGFPLRVQLPRPEQPDISAYELDDAL